MPLLVTRKLRRLELQTGAPRQLRRRIAGPNTDQHDLHRARFAEAVYTELTTDWKRRPHRTRLSCVGAAIGALPAYHVHATASGEGPATACYIEQLRMLKTRLDGYVRRPRPPEG